MRKWIMNTEQKFRLVLLLVLFFVAEISHADECLKREEHSSVTFLLIDKTDKNTNIQQLTQSFDALVEKIVPGERFVAGVSTGKQSEARIIVDVVKPEGSVWESVLKIRAKEKGFATCLQRARTELTNQNESHPSSALLETLIFVSSFLNADSASEKRVMLLSDMVQNSTVLSFYGKGALQPAAAIKTAETNKLLANFPGVSVIVAGAGTHTTDERSRKIEEFWRLYFERAGAKVLFFGTIFLG
jgi:hypothetical protein